MSLRLTPKETKIMTLVGQGYTTAEIAGKVETKPGTVQGHITKVCAKLNVNSRNDAVRMSCRLGLIPFVTEHDKEEETDTARNELQLVWSNGQQFDQLHLEIEDRPWTPLFGSPIVGEVEWTGAYDWRNFITGAHGRLPHTNKAEAREAVESGVRKALGMEQST